MRKLLLLPAILILIIGALGFPLYKQADNLKKQGDDLVKQNKLEEALAYYKDAYNTFPLRSGLADNISATRLLISSELEYSSIVDSTYAEVQEIPSLGALAPTQLKEGELFVPILMYHHIRVNPRPQDPLWASLNVTPEQLESQLIYLLRNGYHVITLDDLYDALNSGKTLPARPIVLTFDDGYRNFYDNAYPLLKKYNMKAIEFVITAVEDVPAYLTWGEISEMDRSGLIEFGAHTRRHPNLPDLTTNSINYEITQSKADLESHLGKTVNWFAYPYGSYNSYIVSETQKAGYKAAVTTNYSAVQNKDKMYLLPRIMVDGRFTLDEFARRIQQ